MWGGWAWHDAGAVSDSPAYTIRADAMREGTAKTPSADAEGRVRLRDPGFGVYENLSPTLDTGQPHGVVHDGVARRLLPVECERLQGFPDGWTATADDGSAVPSTARHRMTGNAVCAPVAAWIGSVVAAVDADLHSDCQRS